MASGQRPLNSKFVDASTITGVLLAFSLISVAIVIGGNPNGFFDSRSVLIVIFGTLAITTACFTFKEIISAFATTARTIFYRSDDLSSAALNAIEISQIARKRGFLALDEYEEMTSHNSFLKKGVEMIADQVQAKEIQKVLNNEVESLAFRHAKSVSVLRKAAEVSPAMGLIGTLIGLVQMLGNLEDTSTIGPAMAVALLTTFYGAVLSYMFFSPIASKLERNTRDELLLARVYICSIASIAAKESPRKLETLLNSILPPPKRVSYFDLQKNDDSQE